MTTASKYHEYFKARERAIARMPQELKDILKYHTQWHGESMTLFEGDFTVALEIHYGGRVVIRQYRVNGWERTSRYFEPRETNDRIENVFATFDCICEALHALKRWWETDGDAVEIMGWTKTVEQQELWEDYPELLEVTQ